MNEDNDASRRLLEATHQATLYCQTVENAREMEKDEFVATMTDQLPRLYTIFAGMSAGDVGALDYGYYQSYVDEEWYESIRRNVEWLLGPEDVFLETFEEDMKYSDTPIAASISEGLADIFQALYNFVMVVKETDGAESAGAYAECRENFETYWSQTLCNVMRALNYLRFNPDAQDKN